MEIYSFKEVSVRNPIFNFSQAGLWFGILLVISLAGCSMETLNQLAQADKPAETETAQELQPNPSLAPEDVVRIQVEALQGNDETNKGIEITFRFASPANKQVTGPLTRFVRMVQNPTYRPMLNHKTAKYDPIEISDNKARQRVTIIAANGKAAVYVFELTKQTSPGCPGCWMTDSVILIPTRQQDLKEI